MNVDKVRRRASSDIERIELLHLLRLANSPVQRPDELLHHLAHTLIWRKLERVGEDVFAPINASERGAFRVHVVDVDFV